MTVLLASLLTVCSWPATWPFYEMVGGGGVEYSWRIGLPLALSDGLVWGRDVIFTYGPLGFTAHPIAVTAGTLLPALLVLGAVLFLLVGVLLVALRRQYGTLVGALLTLAIATMVAAFKPNATFVIGFGIAALALTTPQARSQRAFSILAAAGGALAAFTLLVKFGDGVAVAAIVAVALAAGPSPRRALALGVGSGAIVLVVLWLVLGQPLPALPDYARYGLETVRGYVESMGGEGDQTAGTWQLLTLLGSATALAVLAWTAFPDLERRRRAGLVAIVLLAHYFVLRQIFIRHQLIRGANLVLLVPIAVMIPWPKRRRALALSVAAVLAIASFASWPRSPIPLVNPVGHASAMVHQLRAGIDGSRRDALIASGYRAVDAVDKIPPNLMAALQGHCVNAEPTEIAIIWRYQLNWCPLPALQSYNAYTNRLDKLNADAYADPVNGPDRVVRSNFAIDDRLPAWESPAAMLSMLCHFREIGRSDEWQVLARVADRCGSPRPVATLHAELGEAIRLPAAPPGSALVGHVDGLQVGTIEGLTMLFGRAAKRTISVNGSRGYRVVPDTVNNGIILSVPPDADYPAPFNLGLDATTMTANIEGADDGAVTVHLTAVPVRREKGHGSRADRS